MPKTTTNSRRCNCCQRLVPCKLRKRRYCSLRCAKTDNPAGRLAYLRQISPAPVRLRGGAASVEDVLSGHRVRPVSGASTIRETTLGPSWGAHRG